MYAGLSTVIVCTQKRAKYALGEPKLDVKDIIMYVKEILSHLLALFWQHHPYFFVHFLMFFHSCLCYFCAML